MGKVNPGEQISAAAWNRMVEASEWFHRHMARGQGRGAAQQTALDSAFVKVQNLSGAARRQGEILEFTGFAIADPSIPDKTFVWMKGGAPAIANSFGVLCEPVFNSTGVNAGIATAQIFGGCTALVNVIDANHKYACPKKDSYVLQSSWGGPVRILYKPAGTGEKTCAVFVTGDPTGIVKPVSDIGKGAAGDCQVWLNGADTGAIVNLLALGADVTGGKYCTQWAGYVLPWECG